MDSKPSNQQSNYLKQINNDSDDEVHIIESQSNEHKIMKLKQSDQSLSHIKEQQDDSGEVVSACIKNWTTDRTLIKLQTHYFQVQITVCSLHQPNSQKKWEISRRYSDFQWLYNALKYSYPGCILPYFPTKNIQTFMQTKLGIKTSEEPIENQMHLRKNQLEKFIDKICEHKILKKAQETNIFLSNQKEQFLKNKQAIEAQIQEAKASQSSTNGVVSIFERGIAWITSNNPNTAHLELESVEGWKDTEEDIGVWMKQFTEIVEKVKNMIAIKTQEIAWEGPDTQLDSIEDFKAKVMSGRQFNKLFVEDLENKLIKSIEYETKNLKQLQEQLQQRQNIIKIIQYIYKFTNDTNRCNKLIRKKQKFETNMIREWKPMNAKLKEQVRRIHHSFNQAWKSYCLKMHKIWKAK